MSLDGYREVLNMEKTPKIFKINYHVGKSIHGPSDFDTIVCHYTIDEAFEIIRSTRNICIETRDDPSLRINWYTEIELIPGTIIK
jgi:hypothetical protein